MVTRLGTQLGTQLGTDLSTFTDNPPPAVYDPTRIYALTNYSTTGRYTTQAGGGEAGDVAGFGSLVLTVVEKLPTAVTSISSRRTTGQGYLLTADSTAPGYVYSAINDGVGTSIGTRLTTGHALAASDIGKILPLILSHTGALVGCAAWDGSIKRTTAITGYTPGAAQSYILGSTGTDTALAPFASLTYRGTPTDPQIRAVLAAARTLGDFPSKAAAEALMPGTTVTHRWSVRDTLAAANVAVVDGQAAPATIADSVTAATVDALSKVGTPTIKVLDPTAPKLWSFETTPIFQGADTFTSANYYISSLDDASSASGFWWALLVYMPAVTQSSNVIVGAATTSAGFDVRAGANNTTANWFIGDGSVYNASGSAVMVTNKINLIVGVWDFAALKQRTYGNRTEVGTGLARTAYAPPVAGTKLGLGRTARDPSSAGGSRAILGYAQGNGVPTLAQVQALYDAVQSTESMQSIPSMTASVFVDFTSQIVANSGVLPASLANTGSQGGTFTRTGSPAITALNARAFAW